MTQKQTSSSEKSATRKTEPVGKKQSAPSGTQGTKSARVIKETSSGQAKQSVAFTHEQIAERAKEIWQRRGCPTGQDEKNWLEAENQLKRELNVRS